LPLEPKSNHGVLSGGDTGIRIKLQGIGTGFVPRFRYSLFLIDVYHVYELEEAFDNDT